MASPCVHAPGSDDGKGGAWEIPGAGPRWAGPGAGRCRAGPQGTRGCGRGGSPAGALAVGLRDAICNWL